MNIKKICLCTLSIPILLSGCKLVPNNYDNNDIVISKEYYNGNNNDIILTMYDKNIVNISDLGKRYINEIENIPIDYESKWIDLLNINISSLNNRYVLSNTNKHNFTKYYDSSNNNIKWDKLVDIIYENSILRENNSDYVALSKDEIKIVLSQMNEFLDIVLRDYPSFDVANLACKLNDLSLVYFYREESDKAKASCIQDMISIGINPDGTKPNLNNFKGLIFHEFKHYFCFCCKDEMNGSYHTAGGISSKDGYDINLLFLEEAVAEEYAASKSDRDMTCYSNQYVTLNTLRLVLSLQDDYEEDNFIKNQLLHRPIELLQQFPVYDDKKIYYRNIVMLECFNELLMNDDSYRNNIDKFISDTNGINFTKQEAYQTLLNYSISELNRMFFSNLVSLNEKYDVSLDYNMFLIELYKNQINKTFNVLNSNDLDNSIYLNNFEECNNKFINYYSEYTNIDLESINKYINYYKLRIPSEYPEYVSEDKIKLYDYLYSDKYNKVLVYK